MKEPNEKQAEIDDALYFLGPRLRELLRRITIADRRDDPIQEIAYLIEERAGISRQVPLDGLPTVVWPTKTRAREISPQAEQKDLGPPPGSTGG